MRTGLPFLFALSFSVASAFFPGPAGAADEAHKHSDHDDTHQDEPGLIELEWERAAAEGVTFASAGPAEIRERLALNGEVSLNGDSIVHVSPRFAGVLKKVEKGLGDDVKAGELLAVVQSNESLSAYDIRSEVPGTIIEKDATRGEFVRDDKNLFVIADLSEVWVNAAVYPEQLRRVNVGTPVLISSRSNTETAKANISYLRPSLSEITRTALARVVLPNSGRIWIPGMFVKVEALLEPARAAIAVPARSVQMIENRPVVFVREKSPDGHEAFRPRIVVTGRSDGELTEIVHGVAPGEEIASGNTYILKAELGKGSAEHEH